MFAFFKKKSFIVSVIIAILILIIIWVGLMNPGGILDKYKQADGNMVQVINEYIEEQVSEKNFQGKTFATHDFYGYEEKDGKITAYLWTYYMEYYLNNGDLDKGTGASIPVVIILERDDSGYYSVIDHKELGNGTDYSSTMKELFPEEFHKRISKGAQNLEPLVIKKAEEYYRVNPQINNISDINEETVAELVFEDYSMEPIPVPIAIRNKDEIETIIKALKIERWEPLNRLEYDLAPNFFINVNDRVLIGLYGKDDYAMVKIDNKTKHYTIPPDIQEKIVELVINPILDSQEIRIITNIEEYSPTMSSAFGIRLRPTGYNGNKEDLEFYWNTGTGIFLDSEINEIGKSVVYNGMIYWSFDLSDEFDQNSEESNNNVGATFGITLYIKDITTGKIIGHSTLLFEYIDEVTVRKKSQP